MVEQSIQSEMCISSGLKENVIQNGNVTSMQTVELSKQTNVAVSYTSERIIYLIEAFIQITLPSRSPTFALMGWIILKLLVE